MKKSYIIVGFIFITWGFWAYLTESGEWNIIFMFILLVLGGISILRGLVENEI